MNLLIILFSVGALLGFTTSVEGGVSCKDESGNAVDWFYALKLPVISKDADPTVAGGYAYMYGDVHNPTLKWTTSNSLAQNQTGAIATTLSQIYEGKSSSSLVWLMYNDQLVGQEKTDYAHSKGVLAADNSAGFWLVHSVPRFPVPPSDTAYYYYPSYETENGQSFLCISLKPSVVDQVADLLLTNKPYVFANNFPISLSTLYPSISSVLAKKWTKTPTSQTTKLVSSGGIDFIGFAKTMTYGQDLYEDLVSPTLNTDLTVQSWREGTLSDLMPSFCTPEYSYNNYNVLTITVHASDSSKTEAWSYTKDHSKWAVTTGTGHYACIGDINRMYSQYHRGGGTVCFNNQAVFSSLSAIIGSYEKCT